MKKNIGKVLLACASCLALWACGTSPAEESVAAEIKEDIPAKTSSWAMNIREETIEVEGLSKEYRYLYITDMHIVADNGADAEDVKQYASERMPQFVNAEAVTAKEQFPDWIEYANQMRPDGVLLGGDLIDSPSDSNVDFLKTQLEELQVPYLYGLGNHDWTYPWDYMTDRGKEAYLPKLEPYMQSSPYIQSYETEEFLIVAVDNSSNQVAPEALEEYKQLLQKGKPVIVMLHVPLYTEAVLEKAKEVWGSPAILGGGVHGGIYPNEVSTEFLELTKADDSPVVAVLAGHIHLYHRDMLKEKIVQIVGDAGYKGEAIWLRLVPANASSAETE